MFHARVDRSATMHVYRSKVATLHTQSQLRELSIGEGTVLILLLIVLLYVVILRHAFCNLFELSWP